VHLCVVAGISGLGKRDIARKLVGQLKRRRVAGSPKVGKPADVEQELQELIPSGSPVWMGDRDRLAAFIGQAAPEEVRISGSWPTSGPSRRQQLAIRTLRSYVRALSITALKPTNTSPRSIGL